MVVGKQGAGGAWLLGGLVVPDRGGEGEESLQDARGDAGGGAPAVAFEAELGFEGLVDDSMIWGNGRRNARPLGRVLFWWRDR